MPFLGFCFSISRRVIFLFDWPPPEPLLFPKTQTGQTVGSPAARRWQRPIRHPRARFCGVLKSGARNSLIYLFVLYWKRKNCLKPTVLYSGAPPAEPMWIFIPIVWSTKLNVPYLHRSLDMHWVGVFGRGVIVTGKSEFGSEIMVYNIISVTPR